VAFADNSSFSLKPDLPSETVASLIFWKDKKDRIDRDELTVRIPAKQESDEIKELLKTLREMTDLLIKLSEEETHLREELAKVENRNTDPSAHLAAEVLSVGSNLDRMRGRLMMLKDQIEKAKKEQQK
jgi:hypothetical protein